MQNAWSALRGAVNEINAVLLSEDEEEDEDNGDEGPLRQRRDLEVLIKQQQAQHEAATRQLEQSEAETAKYAKQLASLRRECRQLRAQLASQQQQQQQVNGFGGEGDIGAWEGGAPLPSSSRGSSGYTVLHEAYGQPAERLCQALRLSASQLAGGASADPSDLHEALCSSLERATSHAEFVLKEWENTRTSAIFQALLTQPLARSLPVDLLTWMHEGEGSEGPPSGTVTPGAPLGGPPRAHLKTPLISCVRLTARLVRCAGALAVSGAGEGFDGVPFEALGAPGGAPGGPPRGPWGSTPGGPSSREASLVSTPRLEEVEPEGSSGVLVQTGTGSSETEKKLREEIAKRQQLQHQAAALQRRVMELTEDLKDSKQLMNERREAERERAKTAESEEAERLRAQLQSSEERLATVRELYEQLLQQYERRHAEAASPSAGELDREVQDLLLQLRSWQSSHAGVCRTLQDALAELAELRADAARAQALEKEVETIKREAGRLEEIREIQNISEVELVKAHADRDALEKELQETKSALEKYARVLKRVQTDSDSTISRLRSDLQSAMNEAEGMRSERELTLELKGKVQGLEQRLEEAEEQRLEAAATAERQKKDNEALSKELEKLLQKLQAQAEEQEYFIDRRIVAQMIAKHQQLEGQLKRRDEVFFLLCDVLGFDEEDRQRLGLPRKPGERSKGSGLSEQFVEFLNDEVS